MNPRLPIALNPSLGIPIYRQIMNEITRLVGAGTLPPGSQLPSIRELAAQLRINPSSAVKAYSELAHAGTISLDHGRGTFVSEGTGVRAASRERALEGELDRLRQAARTLGVSDQDLVKALERRLKDARRPT